MHYREILQNYILNKQKPPMVFIAILANDLHGVVNLLPDCEWSNKDLFNVVDAVYKHVPPEARGSLFKIEQWIGTPI
tara:strand:+ start:4329 stop:4559 length:231 start_codon:yes stop_codon:yes gene_type:complete